LLLWPAIFLILAEAPLRTYAADAAKTFPTAEEALSALATAVNARDREALKAIFGPAIDELTSPDRVQATNELAAFAEAMSRSRRLVKETTNSFSVEVGGNAYSFPVPIVQQQDGRWFFDTAAGKEEVINRRIGRNEIGAITVARVYVQAQREYASKDRDDDEVLEYAQRLLSTPGKKDGLYWPIELDGELSPLGPLVALAREEGYRREQNSEATEGEQARPYHGYFYRILTRQGPAAPGGKYDYIINGNMIAGFALLAYPADYGETGIMSFIVNQQGKVYQKDLGPKTAEVAKSIEEYNPDKTWSLSPD
jgi:hypothetical protein